MLLLVGRLLVLRDLLQRDHGVDQQSALADRRRDGNLQSDEAAVFERLRIGETIDLDITTELFLGLRKSLPVPTRSSGSSACSNSY
jgi:hypothetical protein